MSKEYKSFEKYWRDCDDRDTMAGTAYQAWHARDANILAILAQFEALAGKWDHESSLKVGPNEDCQPIGWCAERSGKWAVVCRVCELSALIQSVKERM